ncbi:hypothetical protein CP965_07290 [Halarcobacter mediterraneus]|uniref:Pyruvate carboxyltransferase domain-containing protein n=1 Tax=Halarcobacter mediterraneus TaxID=2023153 RepID=A0A4V1M1G6_9BACT|nr:hypothetical protein [Halarcobacter mediterraneus]RXK13594.1 hypothetical protein CP965_07290 [Halarcobacter mediterraneus]
MTNLNLEILDCTLRDGGYVNDWRFSSGFIEKVINTLTNARVENIECGYFIKDKKENIYGALFNDLNFLKKDPNIDIKGKESNFFAMVDVAKVEIDDIPNYSGQIIDTLRVVFYKHQINIALPLIKSILDKGFKVLAQPMVTIDYSENEYIDLLRRIDSRVSMISIVDSFGNITKNELIRYIKLLDNTLDNSIGIGLHLHDNLENAILLLNNFIEYAYLINCKRKLIIDSSLSGIGRGAGNLKTEILAYHMNELHNYEKYDIYAFLDCINTTILPLKHNHNWGSDPFTKATALLNVHPNYAKFLRVVDPNISLSSFVNFIKNMPEEYRTHCRLEKTRKLYEKNNK